METQYLGGAAWAVDHPIRLLEHAPECGLRSTASRLEESVAETWEIAAAGSISAGRPACGRCRGSRPAP